MEISHSSSPLDAFINSMGKSEILERSYLRHRIYMNQREKLYNKVSTIAFVPCFSWDRVDFLHNSGITLCFGFRKKTLTTHQCFSCCWVVLQSQKCFSFSPCHTVLPAGSSEVQGAGRGQNQNNLSKLAKRMFHTLWHSARKL